MAKDMNITRISVRLNENTAMKNVKAFATVVLNDAFRICGLKVIDGAHGLFVGYPSVRKNDGAYFDLVAPVTREGRKAIQEKVLNTFHQQMISGSAA